ncbi:MAG: hypothetical protein ABSF26_08150 [Thermoguttaceae bacterium]|jgi:hypothetical protein
MHFHKLCVLVSLAGIFGARRNVASAEVIPPPNRPADVNWRPSGELRLGYHGSTIFEGTVRLKTAAGERSVAVDEIRFTPIATAGEKVVQQLSCC